MGFVTADLPPFASRGARIDVTVCTPHGQVVYDGDATIDGVSEPAAPVYLNFLDAWGASTGQLFPTGARRNLIDGVEVSCIDAAMPMVMMPAAACMPCTSSGEVSTRTRITLRPAALAA